MTKWSTVSLAGLTLAYPLAIHLLLAHMEPRWLAPLPCVLALSRALITRARAWWGATALSAALAAWALSANAAVPLKLYPVVINAALLVAFATSLRYGTPVIERLARLREPDLHGSAVAYTRRVTQVWCVFFVLNGSAALATAMWASERAWAIYNGVVAYMLIGLLFAVEWLVRQRVRARR